MALPELTSGELGQLALLDDGSPPLPPAPPAYFKKRGGNRVSCDHGKRIDTMAHDGIIRKLRCNWCLHRWVEIVQP